VRNASLFFYLQKCVVLKKSLQIFLGTTKKILTTQKKALPLQPFF